MLIKNKNANLIIFSGKLHDIDFRHAIFELSKAYENLCGYVRNIPDFAIELLLIGEQNEIEMFLDDIIHHELGCHITSMDYSKIDNIETYNNFSII